ncbi:MAG: NAD-dependent malic enzyme, mitochondrial [Piccolia ochrophora]|nr:MAG: NAD-dependent malic enzyme, mitochondrial [Piccolia ochrophora]
MGLTDSDLRYLALVIRASANEQLLSDDLYLGLRRPRVRGGDYDAFVDKFVTSARELYPRAYIHFEDFGLHNAQRLLDKYRGEISCFNDDVQGTGCVTLAAIISALNVAKHRLAELRLVIYGSGSAGTGIAAQVRDAIATETQKSKAEAAKQIWCIDKPGLLLQSLGENLTPAQVPFARDDNEWKGKSLRLLEVIKEVKPHVLIGTSTRPKAFTEEIVKEVAKHVDRPIIFPLSNPTRLHEVDPKDVFEWTGGKALIATGSPFPPVAYGDTTYEVAECNNSVCFPGIGLGAVLSRSRVLSDKMLLAAVKALAAQSPALKDPNKGLLPDVVDVRELSVKVAMAVIKQAVAENLAQEKEIPTADDLLEEWVKEQMWEPRYRELKPVDTRSG